MIAFGTASATFFLQDGQQNRTSLEITMYDANPPVNSRKSNDTPVHLLEQQACATSLREISAPLLRTKV